MVVSLCVQMYEFAPLATTDVRQPASLRSTGNLLRRCAGRPVCAFNSLNLTADDGPAGQFGQRRLYQSDGSEPHPHPTTCGVCEGYFWISLVKAEGATPEPAKSRLSLWNPESDDAGTGGGNRVGAGTGSGRKPGKGRATYSGLGSGIASSVNPDVLSHDLALLIEGEILGELCSS